MCRWSIRFQLVSVHTRLYLTLTMLVEEYMGRPDKFDMLPHEFEDMIKDYFDIVDSDRICSENRGESYMGSMYYYFLKCKK